MPGVSIPATNYYFTNYIPGFGTGTPQFYPSGEGIEIQPPYSHVNNGCADIYYGGEADVTLMPSICINDGNDVACQTLSCSACDPKNAGLSSDSGGPVGLNPTLDPQEYPSGMPKWWVSEPYINLWAADRPVEYTTSLGEKVSFAMTYKQRQRFMNQTAAKLLFQPDRRRIPIPAINCCPWTG
jgi:hypothetical protein